MKKGFMFLMLLLLLDIVVFSVNSKKSEVNIIDSSMEINIIGTGVREFILKEKNSTINEFQYVNVKEIQVEGKTKSYGNTIVLNYKENLLNLLIDYNNNDTYNDIDIYYKLSKYDANWNILNHKKNKDILSITYDNLSSGNYTLYIMVKKNNCVNNVISINVMKEKSPASTLLAHILYLSVVLILILLIIDKDALYKDLVVAKNKEFNTKIKENNEKYEKIISNERGKNDFFINLSHELRTPLNVILSTEQLITSLNSREEHIDKKKLEHYMDILRSNSKRLLKLINDIIDKSRIESGAYKLEVTEHEIVYHIEDLVLSMKEFIESKGINLIIEPEMEEKYVECDINDIEKCIVNLVGNAVKFTPTGGYIYVRMFDLGEKVKISIQDTGIGIESKDIDSIFDRFGQTYNKKSEEFGGSGIGLALTRQLVKLHHGELQVESELGKGSEFSIIIPIKQPKD